MKTRSFGVSKFKGLLLVGCFSVSIEFLMGLTDSVVAGNLLGESALSAVNILQPILSAVTFFAGMVGVGMGVNYAIQLGCCAERRAREIFTQGLWTVLAGGAALMLACAFFAAPFVAFMGVDAETGAYARDYLLWFAPVALLEPLALLFLNCCYADGDKRICFVSYAVQLAVNAAFSVVFVKAGMGTAGCALGTLLGNVAAIAALSVHFFRKSNTFRIFRTSFGDSSAFLCLAAVQFAIAKIAVLRFGPDVLPVVSAVIITFSCSELFDGTGAALQPVVSVYTGERNTLAVKRVLAAGLRVSLVVGVLSSILLAVCPDVIVRLIGIDDPEVLDGARTAVRLSALSFLAFSPAGLLNSYLVTIGKEMLAVVLTVLVWFAGPLAALLVLLPIGPSSVALGLSVGSVLALVAFWAVVIARKGRRVFPHLLVGDFDRRIRMFDLRLDAQEIARTAQAVAETLKSAGADPSATMRASLMTEEVLMAVLDRNAGRKPVLAEVTLDLNDGVKLTLRDDGEIFDITDTDQKISSLRTFLVASVMERQKTRKNMVTTGFNRNVFKF